MFEIVLPFRGDAFRVIYAVQIADEIWVVHAFQKKSPRGRKMRDRSDQRPLATAEGDVVMKSARLEIVRGVVTRSMSN